PGECLRNGFVDPLRFTGLFHHHLSQSFSIKKYPSRPPPFYLLSPIMAFDVKIPNKPNPARPLNPCFESRPCHGRESRMPVWSNIF
ncbi:MAG TPA: hypothetical protein PLU95_03750, partial [Syntrophales bacterium]|nr:hypothetical protein [Syntrophales bacterium]